MSLRRIKMWLMARIFVLPECFRGREEITQLAAPGFVCLVKYYLVHRLKKLMRWAGHVARMGEKRIE
jgi:hypothetical protein